MSSDEINWLLQTIEDPETAKRFVQAQYERGRIPYHVITNLAWEHGWADWPAVEASTAPISMENIPTFLATLTATQITVPSAKTGPGWGHT
jgi:hypothetical protein